MARPRKESARFITHCARPVCCASRLVPAYNARLDAGFEVYGFRNIETPLALQR